MTSADSKWWLMQRADASVNTIKSQLMWHSLLVSHPHTQSESLLLHDNAKVLNTADVTVSRHYWIFKPVSVQWGTDKKCISHDGELQISALAATYFCWKINGCFHQCHKHPPNVETENQNNKDIKTAPETKISWASWLENDYSHFACKSRVKTR